MGSLSVSRARKYEFLKLESTQLLIQSQGALTSLSRYDRKYFAHLRIRLLSGFKTSLFKFLLFRDGELLYRKSKLIYGLAPLIGFVLSFLVAVESQRKGNLGAIATSLLVIVAAFAIADLMVGIFATLGFGSMQFVSAGINSIRDILIVLSLSFIWVLPGVLSNFFVTFYEKDHAEIRDKRFINSCVAAVLSIATIYTGMKLINSVVENVKENHTIAPVYFVLLGAVAFIKEFAFGTVVLKETNAPAREDFTEFSVKRITSPTSGFALFVLADGFIYMWIGKAALAFGLGLLISLPLFFLSVRLSSSKSASGKALKRSMLNEALGVSFLAAGIYFAVQEMPLLLDEKLINVVAFSTLAVVVHAGLSLFIDSADRNRESVK